LNAYWNKIATSKGKAAMKMVYEECSDIAAFALQSLLSYEYTNVGPNLLEQPEVAEVLNSLQLGFNKEYTPTSPLYVVHGTEDEVSNDTNV
jgi:hypothetical protein